MLANTQWAQSGSFTGDATTLANHPEYAVQRGQQFVVTQLKKPHRLYSTSNINGGERRDIRFLVNHQSMEANGDNQRMAKILTMSHADYHQAIASQLQLNPKAMVLMGTAADMNFMGQHRSQFASLAVDAYVTAGVSANALRAGDPSRWYETAQGNKPVADFSGTINTVLIINQPLCAGAQAKAMMLAVEAKSAALAELAVPSTVSRHLATGTGTDQITIASVIDSKLTELQSASGHLK